MLSRVRQNKYVKAFAIYMAINMLIQIINPATLMALTSGPSQPEVQSFQPVGMSDMVDPFTGDFSYNIPLLDVGGYPVNLIYNAGITMDQEASWVGLGWNINPGVITRNMRGVPDDFNGDEIKQENNLRPATTVGLSIGGNIELFGQDSKWAFGLGYSLGVNYSNYEGVGFEQTLSPKLSSTKNLTEKNNYHLGLNISASKDGLNLMPNISFDHKQKAKKDGDYLLGGKIGVTINNRTGLKSLSYGITGEKYVSEKEKAEHKKSGKKDAELLGSNGGSSISLTPNTYLPQIQFPRVNNSISYSAKTGAAIFGFFNNLSYAGYVSTSELMFKKDILKSYGFLYEQNAMTNDKAILDFNREKDNSFTRSTTNLPVINHTYDVFSIAGEGIGGTFRPFRNDVGYLYDPYSFSPSGSGNLGMEIGLSSAAHYGFDFGLNVVNSSSGLWKNKHNKLKEKLEFQNQNDNNLYEPVFFKQAGEKNVDEDAANPNGLLKEIGRFEPVYIEIDKGPGYQSTTTGDLKSKFGTTVSSPTAPLKRFQNPQSSNSINRVKRNQPVGYLKKNEIQKFGVEGYESVHAKGHHIGEFSIYRTDGNRYVYGIPAYNTIQKDVTFNCTGNTADCNSGLVNYSGTDASIQNKKGIDHYFNSSTTPPYAHSYLLTSVLSADYSDVDAIRGPSAGDLGSYTKFNYDANPTVQGIQPSIPKYRWRTPFPQNKAYYNEGLKSDKLDNKGSLVYGEKELWYIQSIETKTHIAIFHTSPRRDGFESNGETGGVGLVSMLKLDSISLYSIIDYKANPQTAECIKRVHFRYDYSLCPNVPNNDGQMIDESGNILSVNGPQNINQDKGKLTLTKVFFTYQKSHLGRLSGYTFDYGNTDHTGTREANPAYNIKGYDRWGYYAPNNAASNCNNISNPLSAAEYPYTTQNKSDADLYATSWSLTDIKLPSGGKIQIDYESDDYAFVQDKDAMQMFKITGSGNTKYDSPTGSDALYSGQNPYKFLFFQVPSSLSNIGDVEFKKRFIRDLIGYRYMYFRFFMGLKRSNHPNQIDECDFVSGYCKILDAGIENGYGWVEVEPVSKKDDKGYEDTQDCHPISKAAWNFGRTYNQRLMYNFPDPVNGTSLSNLVNALANASIINGIVELFQNANGVFRSKNYGQKFVQNKSWIRLYSPENKKLGGGLRVKELRIYDMWEDMSKDKNGNSTDAGFHYGQVYSYSLADGSSSGVASNEPQAGGDENPLHQPIFITNRHILAPDEQNYVETPFGESFFPSPGVGYSYVTVKNLPRSYGSPINKQVKRHATGKTVNEFYTAKDFPVRVDYTPLKPIEQTSKKLGNLLNVYSRNNMTASQGYSIELNDMHGKPKAQWVYAEDQSDPISGAKYIYNTSTISHTYSNPIGSGSNQTITLTSLNNLVDVIYPNGKIDKREVGVDVDFVTDFREMATKAHSIATQSNLSAFLIAFVPVAVPTILPSYSSENTRFRSAVTTKVINRYGILRETIAFDLGSEVSTENLGWDAETGEVILTKTKNNFNDPIYNFTYPAHWAYNRMGPAYQNLGYIMGPVTINSNSSVGNTSPCYLVKGDEVKVFKKYPLGGNYTLGKAWVWDTDDDITNGFYLIDKWGKEYTTSSITGAYLEVMRSGRRNMQTSPIGTITSLSNPIVANTSGPEPFKIDFTANTKIINTSMTEFSEKWGTSCNENLKWNGDSCRCETETNTLNQWNSVFQYLFSNNGFCSQSFPVPAYFFPEITENCGYTNLQHVNWEVQNSLCTLTSGNPNGYEVYLNPICVPGCTGNCPIGQNYMDCGFDFAALNQNLQALQTLPDNLTWGNLTSLQIIGVFPSSCELENINSALAVGTFITNENIAVQIMVRITSDCYTFGKCGVQPPCVALSGSIINPFVSNMRGVWRPKKSWLYQTERTQDLVASKIYVRTDGTYQNFNKFWNEPVGSSPEWTKNTSNWTWASEVTQFSPFGFELENKDALNIHSAAIYGYANTLPKAVSSNSQTNQIAFDGFEDYDFIVNNGCCPGPFDFYSYANLRTTEFAHTGRYSMKLTGGGANSINTTRPLITGTCTTAVDDMPFTVKPCDIINPFGPHTTNLPTAGMEYVISYWVKESTPNNQRIFDYTATQCSIVVNSINKTLTTQKGDIIDGWQRVEHKFNILPTDVGNIEVVFNFTGQAGNAAYLDDIRIQPFKSSMKSFVYDPISLRLWAELDERNFATFYEYDNEGTLLRIKKETEKGIMTIQESRNNFSK